MRVLSLLALAACAPAGGVDGPGLLHDAPPSTAAPVDRGRQYRETYELHDVQPCGDGCRYARRSTAKVRLSLEPDGVASARADGAMREKFGAAVGKKERVTRWRLEWRGAWEERDDVVAMRLEPAAAQCDEVAEDASVRALPCGERALALACHDDAVALSDERRYTRALVCEGPPAGEWGPLLPWAFGYDSTLVATDEGTSPALRRSYSSAALRLPRE
jgi:hypothetical protein